LHTGLAGTHSFLILSCMARKGNEKSVYIENQLSSLAALHNCRSLAIYPDLFTRIIKANIWYECYISF
jgi:hypothetical protein